MDRTLMTPVGVRRRLWVLSLASLVVLAGFSGCSHRRSSMRPVFGTPVVGGATVVGGSTTVVTPGDPGAAVITNPLTGAPSSTINSANPDAEPMLSPINSSNNNSSRTDSGVNKTGGSPPVPAEVPEPPLNGPAGNDPTAPTSSNRPSGVSLDRPTAYQGPGRSASVPVKQNRNGLRQAVARYASDADGLFSPGKADRPWKYIVVHHSATDKGGLDQIDREHRKVLGFEGCGYHFVIGNGTDSPDGQIEISERWFNQKHGVHCRNGKNADVNEYGIGICLVGNFDNQPPTPKQIAATKALVAYLADRYQVDAEHRGSHDQFAEGPTACPGKNFPGKAIFGSKHVAAR